MDISEEFEDESPCFIVPNSQASESGVERNLETLNEVVLRGLTMLQPASNMAEAKLGSASSVDQYVDNSPESVFPNSLSSEAQSNDTSSPSLASSKNDSSDEKQEVEKKHALCLTRSDRVDITTPQNFNLMSTPMVQGNVSPYEETNEKIARLTPVEHVTANSTSYTFEKCKGKETSSSDEIPSPSLDLVLPESLADNAEKCEMMQDKTNLTRPAQEKTLCDAAMSTVQTGDNLVLSGQEINEQITHHKLQEKTTSTDTFECLQFSGECKARETSSSDNAISPSSELLRPESPAVDQIDKMVHEKASTDAEEHKMCEEEQPADKNNEDTAGNMSNLPRWQQQIMSRSQRSSPVNGTLTRTTSSISTSSNQEISPQESSLHQWQSPRNGSDDLFETDHNTNHDDLPIANDENMQDSSISKHPDFKGLSLPVLSQDIFQLNSKGVPGRLAMPADVQHSRQDDDIAVIENVETRESAAEKLESSPDGYVLPSQGDEFFLHLTQSQSSTVASQARSQTDRQTSLIDIDTGVTMDMKGHTDIVQNVTPPLATLSNTVLPPTPLGHPSTTGHHEDIANRTDTGQINRISMSSESSTLTTTTVGNTPEQLELANELETGVDNNTLNESSESIESGLVSFHFSPPATLLKPVVRTTPSCLKTSSETIPDPNQEVVSTTEFRPTSPDLVTTLPEVQTSVPIATLSLSVPVPNDENTDEDGQELEFNLQKDILAPDVGENATFPTPPERSVFTKVRERFQPVRESLPDDGIDPFEFRDEVYTSPMRKRKRIGKTGSEQRPGTQKRIRVIGAGECGINKGDGEGYQPGNDATKVYKSNLQEAGEKSNKERFWRIVKTRTVTTTTTLIETETEVIYTAQNGVVITKDTKHEVSEPTYKTTTNEKETRAKVAVVPTQITFDDVESTVDVRRAHVETCTSSGNKKTTTVKECAQRKSNIPATTSHNTTNYPTGNKDAIVTDIAENHVNEISVNTPTTDSPPLFPSSTSSSSSSRGNPVEKVTNAEGDSISPPEKQTTDNAPSLPKEKHTRFLFVDKQRTSRRSSRSPHETLSVLHEGTRVLALWHDRHYYPGHVAFKSRNDAKYRIKFDDGNQIDIREQCIIVIEYLPCDQPVMFCQKTGGEYVDGLIRGFYKNGNERGYKVIGEDNKVVLCPRSDVILSAEQAAIFLSLRDSRITEHSAFSESLESSPVLGNNVSRQNKVTKVPRRSDEHGTNKSLSSDKHFSNGSRPLTDKDTNAEQKPQDKRGKRKESVGEVLPEKEGIAKKIAVRQRPRKRQNSSGSETPKSSHKSTGKKSHSSTKKGKVMDNKDVDVHVSRVRRRLSTVMKGSLNKTSHIPKRTSPRKLGSRTDTAGHNENLILPTNKDLFRGFGFLLTGNDVKCPLGDENSPQEEEQVFIRSEVCLQIRTGGGEVLSKFPEEYQSDSCFLLSNACQTTAKYFYALVLGVPCLSHAWIRDCCVENRLISFDNYLLPAGKDLITERLVEKQNYGDALRGLNVHLVGDDEFKQEWNEILKAAGCEVIPKLPTNILQKLQFGETDFACDVIVVGNCHVSHSTIHCVVQKARLLGIPTVTIQWVKQCILIGRRVDFNAHESFIYRVQKNNRF